MLASPARALLRFVEVVDALSIPYAVGGSLASGVFGEPRATHDFDVLVALRPAQVQPLAGALATEFYFDREAISEALSRASSFNVIHLASAQKIDVFVAGERLLDREQLARRVSARALADVLPVYVTSAEVIVLRKLDWFRRGGEVSERQWRDVISVLRVQGDRLDREYLSVTARELGLQELLERALAEAGSSS